MTPATTAPSGTPRFERAPSERPASGRNDSTSTPFGIVVTLDAERPRSRRAASETASEGVTTRLTRGFLRHPIPVSLSRQDLPRLKVLLSSDFRELLTAEQAALSERIVTAGSDLDRAVLDWCLQTAIPLARAEPDWTIVTYEQLVVDPLPVLRALSLRLELPRPERMERRLTTPSSSTHQSDQATRDRLGDADRTWLIDKWKAKAGPADVARAMETLSAFGIGDLYRPESALPGRFWVS